jgi:predicted amidohydrolase
MDLYNEQAQPLIANRKKTKTMSAIIIVAVFRENSNLIYKIFYPGEELKPVGSYRKIFLAKFDSQSTETEQNMFYF